MAAAHGNGVQGFFKRDIWLLEESEEREEEEEEGEEGEGEGEERGSDVEGSEGEHSKSGSESAAHKKVNVCTK